MPHENGHFVRRRADFVGHRAQIDCSAIVTKVPKDLPVLRERHTDFSGRECGVDMILKSSKSLGLGFLFISPRELED